MIEFDSLTVSWRSGEAPVLQTGLFSVPAGVIPLLGVNGSGKTTFSLAASRLLEPPAAVTGSVRFSKSPKPGPKVHYLPAVLSAELDYSVSDLFKIAGVSIRPEIEPLEVGGLLKRGFRTLSAGEAQRVLIARALCIRPDLLILDEALSALDPEAFAASYRALQQYAVETGSTVIWVTHDWNLALELGQRFIWIEKGCVGSGEEGDALRGFLERSPKLACSPTERGGIFVHPTLEPFLRATRRSKS